MASLSICMAQVEESFTLLFTASRIAKNSAWEMPAGAGGLLRPEGTHRHGARELRVSVGSGAEGGGGQPGCTR